MIDRDDFKRALGAPDGAFDAAVEAVLSRLPEREERPIMKKKLTLTLVAAVAAALLLTGAALAVGRNLFEYFGARDARLSEIAPKTTLSGQTTCTVESAILGTSTATVNSAYYDGETLILAYTLENSARYEPFVPTEEQLARMTPAGLPDGGEALPPILEEAGAGREYAAAFNEAAARGEACGVVLTQLYPSDHTLLPDGQDLQWFGESADTLEDDAQAVLREYTELPDGAKDLDRLEIHIALYTGRMYCWFDGETYFTLYEQDEPPAGELTATVPRTEAVTLDFAGEGSASGTPVKVTCRASAVQATVEVTPLEGALPYGGGYFELRLSDGEGRSLVEDEAENGPERLFSRFRGTGTLPDSLTLTLVWREDGDETGVALDPIELKPVD